MAPGQVSLTFSKRVEASFAGVQVFDPAGQRAEAGESTVVDTQVTVPLQPLTVPGTYTVVFRIVSGDSHPVESQFTFVYAPPPPPPPAPEPSASAAASASASPSAEPSPQVAPAPPSIELETRGRAPRSACGCPAPRTTWR